MQDKKEVLQPVESSNLDVKPPLKRRRGKDVSLISTLRVELTCSSPDIYRIRRIAEKAGVKQSQKLESDTSFAYSLSYSNEMLYLPHPN